MQAINRQVGSKKGAVGREKRLKSETQLTRLLLTVTFTFLVLNSMKYIVQCFAILEVDLRANMIMWKTVVISVSGDLMGGS